MNYKDYLQLTPPIQENVEFIMEKSNSYDVVIATKCRYEYLNHIWLQENNIELPLIITSKDKVDYLQKKIDNLQGTYTLQGSYIIDDCKKTVNKATSYGMHGLYIPTNSKICDAIEVGNFFNDILR